MKQRILSVAALLGALASVCGCDDGATATPSPCTVDVASRTLRCVTFYDSPATVDEETSLDLTVTLGATAFDGTTRSFYASVDYVTTGFSGPKYDAALFTGLEAGPAHDTSIEGALLWNSIHLPEGIGYDRVEVSGVIAINGAGHGRIDIAWTDPASGRSGAHSINAEF